MRIESYTRIITRDLEIAKFLATPLIIHALSAIPLSEAAGLDGIPFFSCLSRKNVPLHLQSSHVSNANNEFIVTNVRK